MKELWIRYKQRVRRNCLGDYTRTDGLHYWKNKLFATIIIYLLPLGLLLLAPSAVIVYALNLQFLAIAYIIFGLAISFISLHPGLNISFRKFLFLGLIYTVATTLIYFMGAHRAGLTYLFGATVFALLILPTKAGIMTVFINIAVCVLQGFLIHYQIVDYPLRDSYQVASWASISANSILLSIVAVIFLPMLFRGLQDTIDSQNSLRENLMKHRDQLENSLREKETLLAEIHHRVKNNLAVISGMLQIQAFKESNVEMQKKLLDSTLRIKSMANIHEQLYQSHSFSKMAFDEGLKNLVQTILETIDNGADIETVYDLEPIQLNINQAVPCCLIVNEVVTNCIKHAFIDRKAGKVSIKLQKNKHTLSLSITDNGKGIPADVVHDEQESLGFELINTLSQQLKADYIYQPVEMMGGTHFQITFELSSASGSNGL